MFEVTLITPLLPTYQNKVQDIVQGRNNDGRSFKRCDVQDAYMKVVPQVCTCMCCCEPWLELSWKW
jgi:capsular polysaccharide biosynthesis protein